METVHSTLRAMMLPAYYHASRPLRWLGGSVVSWLGKHPIAVVFYHRVADHTPTPWTISEQEFARQIEWLTSHTELISLEEAQRRIARGCNQRRAVCITFDDGYADNCNRALPLLIDRGIPFTYFVASDYIVGNRAFPHDSAMGRHYRRIRSLNSGRWPSKALKLAPTLARTRTWERSANRPNCRTKSRGRATTCNSESAVPFAILRSLLGSERT